MVSTNVEGGPGAPPAPQALPEDVRPPEALDEVAEGHAIEPSVPLPVPVQGVADLPRRVAAEEHPNRGVPVRPSLEACDHDIAEEGPPSLGSSAVR